MGAVEFVLVVAAYGVGMFPSAHLVGRLTGHDPTSEGSRNPGASNVYRTAGRLAGAAVLVADALKGIVPTAVGLAVGGRELGIACGIAAVLGHIAPVTRRFRGGKGVATLGGFTLVMWPAVALVTLAIWIVLVSLTKRASVGALVAVPILPIGVALAGYDWWEAIALAAIAGLVVLRHHENVRRLVRREEKVLPSAVGGDES